MKISFVLLCISVLQVFAMENYAQNTKLSLSMEDAAISEVLQVIEDQSDFKFFYNNQLVDVSTSVDVKARKKNIWVVLDEILDESSITYHVVGKQVALFSNAPGQENYLQQPVTIKGRVTDELGNALPGVNVVLKGTATGTITDNEGEYTLIVTDPNAVLVFSFIGYASAEFPFTGQTSLDVVMLEDAIGLDEVVVIGYGTMKKSDLTGNISRVNTNKNIDLPNTNVLQSLKGQVAGLSVGTPDAAGEAPSLKIRGTNSMSAGNQPLIVVDGINKNGTLNSIDVNDIESVDVLKDASAAAVYGSRSANGVMIITTKKGGSEKPVFNFSASYGMSNPVYLIPVLNPDQYLQKILDYRIATGQEADPANIHDYLTVTESNNLSAGKTINWYDELIQTAITENYTGSVSGRTNKTNYYISMSYFGQEGIVENDDFNRITARANFSNQITDWFTVSVKSSFSNMNYSGIPVGWTFMLSPYSNYYEGGADSGELEYYPMEDPYYRHPYLNLQIDDHDVRTDLWGLISSEIRVPFVKGLKWTLNYGINQRMNKHYNFNDNTLAITQNGIAYKDIRDFFDWTIDNIVSYNRTFNEVHSVDGTLLYSREYQQASSTWAESSNFFNQALGYNSLELGAVPWVSSGFGEQNQTALMGRINYIFNNTFMLTGTVRRDGFSGFAEGNKYATFYSGAFAWTLSNMVFMQDMTSLNHLKLRLSYGENGNQAIGRYQTLARMSSSQLSWALPQPNYVFGDGAGTSNGVFVSSMANDQLGWETTRVVNLGVDFGLFNNLISGSVDLYSSNTEDVLLRRGIPSMTGFTTVWTNIGKVHNQGVEIALNSTPVRANDFTWDLGFVFDLNRNSIESLFGVDEDGDGVEDDDIANRWFIGEPLDVFYGYDIDGIHQTGDSEIPDGYEPGDFRIVDYDGDGELTAEDRYILGYSIPNYQFSISNTFKYKNLSLYVMVNSIQGGGKNNYYMGNNLNGHNPNAPFASWSQRFSFPYMDYWTPDNPSNTAARINYSATRGHSYLEDRSFIRIQDVILSYTMDDVLPKNWNIEGLRLFVSAKNLATFTKWTGYDPENATTIFGRPMLRTISFGADLKF